MLRKTTNEDISEEEFKNVISPFYDKYHNFVEEYVMPEVIIVKGIKSIEKKTLFGYFIYEWFLILLNLNNNSFTTPYKYWI